MNQLVLKTKLLASVRFLIAVCLTYNRICDGVKVFCVWLYIVLYVVLI